LRISSSFMFCFSFIEYLEPQTLSFPLLIRQKQQESGRASFTRALCCGRPRPSRKTWVQKTRPAQVCAVAHPSQDMFVQTMKFRRFYRTSKSAWLRDLFMYFVRSGVARAPIQVRRSLRKTPFIISYYGENTGRKTF
jgi:hypothetical protein